MNEVEKLKIKLQAQKDENKDLKRRIREMLSKAYIDGLKQSRFDKRMLEFENEKLKEEINKISKKELKVYSMLKSIEYGTLTEERLDQIKEVLFELGGDVDDE